MDDDTRLPAAPPGSLRLGTLGGVDVYLRVSWFVIAAIIAITMAPVIEEVEPGLGFGKYVAGVCFAIMLYGSVLLHELSHAWMARHDGLPVRSISLSFMGGMTGLDGESRTPGQEFRIAVVGPLTSLAVGAVAVFLQAPLPDGLLRLFVQGLAGANLVVGALNLVPGLPLDGGRVLRAAVWKGTGNMHRGTIVAAWGGRVVAVLVLLYPPVAAAFGLHQRPLDYVMAAIVAYFLWAGANAGLFSAHVRARLPSLKARPLARRAVSITTGTPVSEAVRRAQEAEAGGIVVVSPEGRPSGVVSEAALLSIPEDRRPWVGIESAAVTLEEALVLPVDIVGEDLVRAMARRPASEYLLVEEDGSLYGILSTQDVDRAFEAGARK